MMPSVESTSTPATSRTRRGAQSGGDSLRGAYALDQAFLMSQICQSLGIQVVRSNLHDSTEADIRVTMFGWLEDIGLANALMEDIWPEASDRIFFAEVPRGEKRAGYMKSRLPALGTRWPTGSRQSSGCHRVPGWRRPSSCTGNIFLQTKRVARGGHVEGRAWKPPVGRPEYPPSAGRGRAPDPGAGNPV